MKQQIRKLDKQNGENEAKPVRLVVAALIVRSPQADQSADPVQGKSSRMEVLICQRKPDQPMSLKWEFPGGKVEAGETTEEALARELNEELGIDAVIGDRVARIRHKYRNGGAIDLQFFVVREFSGALENRIFNDMRWSSLEELPGYDFLAADLGLIRDLSEGRLL